MKLLVDNVVGGEPFPRQFTWIQSLPQGTSIEGQASWLAVSTLALYLINQGILVIKNYLQAGLGSQSIYDLGASLFEHLQRLSPRFHGHQPTGDLVKRVISDSSSIRDVVLSIFIPIATSIVNLLIMFVVMWQLDVLLTFLALTAVPAIFLLIRRFEGPMTDLTYAYEVKEGELMAFASQRLATIPVIQAFNRMKIETDAFRDLYVRTNNAYLKSIHSQLSFNIGVGSATVIGTALIMLIGSLQVDRGVLTLGSLLVFLSYLIFLYSPLQTLAYASSGFASAAAKARRVLEVLDTKEMVIDTAWARPVVGDDGRNRGLVRLEGVTFGYEPDKPIIHDINLEALPGEKIALVGRTGAGKSTLVSMIPRLFDPWFGRIWIGDDDVLTLPLDFVRNQVAIVLQDSYLLPMSVTDNFAYGRPEATMDEIREAAVLANADEFICELPSGYETEIGEKGGTLSGGERQRISIARAFLMESPILILDEPSSALDIETEADLLEAMDRVLEGRTAFIIAHRISTIMNADKIIVLDDGRIIEQGSHEDLYAAGGAYRTFFDLQFGSTSTEDEEGELWKGDWH
jgi:ATP-binding cassette subfamily B protein/subfamily B ATP-binding cassette protein MsbA